MKKYAIPIFCLIALLSLVASPKPAEAQSSIYGEYEKVLFGSPVSFTVGCFLNSQGAQSSVPTLREELKVFASLNGGTRSLIWSQNLDTQPLPRGANCSDIRIPFGTEFSWVPSQPGRYDFYLVSTTSSPQGTPGFPIDVSWDFMVKPMRIEVTTSRDARTTPTVPVKPQKKGLKVRCVSDKDGRLIRVNSKTCPPNWSKVS